MKAIKLNLFSILYFCSLSLCLVPLSVANAEDVYRAKGASAYFHSSPSGSRVGSVYKNLPLKVVETRGEWVKVEVDAWFLKSSISKRKRKSAKNSAGAKAAGPVALAVSDFEVGRRGGFSGEDKKAVLTLTVKNSSKKPIQNWEGVLIVKDKATDKLLFRYPVASDLKVIAPNSSEDFLFGWAEDSDEYHSLLAYPNPQQALKVKLGKVKAK